MILANLVPLGGVLFLGWKILPIMLLFWLENVVIGLFNALKMVLASPQDRPLWLVKLFLVPFFCVHYGIFCTVHGAFVIGLFGRAELGNGLLPTPAFVGRLVTDLGLGWALLALVLSHGFSLVHNYLWSGRYRRSQPQAVMAAPYGRVVVLHLALLFGGFLMMALNSPMLGLLLLIVGKVLLDLKAHLKEHRQPAAGAVADN